MPSLRRADHPGRPVLRHLPHRAQPGPPGSAPPGSRFGATATASAAPTSAAGTLPGDGPGMGSGPATMTAPVATLPPVPDQFMPSRPPRAKRSPGVWLRRVVGLIAVAALAVGAVVFFTRDSNDYPKEWDAQVAPIAARVAQLRGLSFDHPVKVEYLSRRRLREGSDGEPRTS